MFVTAPRHLSKHPNGLPNSSYYFLLFPQKRPWDDWRLMAQPWGRHRTELRCKRTRVCSFPGCHCLRHEEGLLTGHGGHTGRCHPTFVMRFCFKTWEEQSNTSIHWLRTFFFPIIWWSYNGKSCGALGTSQDPAGEEAIAPEVRWDCDDKDEFGNGFIGQSVGFIAQHLCII